MHFNIALDNDTAVCSGLAVEPNFDYGDGGNANANVSGHIFNLAEKAGQNDGGATSSDNCRDARN